ncbi:DUF6493 family protein [Nonomuraea salmonea]|uniref:DUF6493 family protein n=1 Tax=Nonomuraea salmonea TaxID=46181 RepID=A0ABV5NGH8_9ACTN
MDHEDEIRKLIWQRHADRLAERVKALDEPARKRVAAELPQLLKELTATFSRWESDGLTDFGPALRVAGAATLGGAAAVASWLYRRAFAPQWAGPDNDVDLVLAVIADRPAAWRADLAERLTLRLRTADDRGMRLALALLRETGIEPPPHDVLVAGWVSEPPTGLADDPLLDHLLPRLFEAQGVGRELQWQTDPDQGWLGALLDLADSGRVRRADLLDGCLRRFLLGGAPAELRFFVHLHEALDPGPDEVESRARDYLRLLPAAPGQVAESAAKRLRDCSAPTPDDLAEAWESLLFRQERKLVRAGLSWLQAAVRRQPELAGVVAAPLARAFAAESAELQEKAAELALTHAAAMDEEGRATVREAIELLPPRLGGRLAAAFGGAAVAEPVFVPPPLPAVPERARPFDEPPAAPDELVTLWVSMSRTWQTWERLLAGFVTLAGRDRASLAARLEGLRQPWWRWQYQSSSWDSVDDWFSGAVKHVVGVVPEQQAWRRLMPPGRLAVPHRVLLHRAAEILRALDEGTLPPLLLATPTHDTGHVAAAELVRRLEVLEAAGAKPLAADFQQALLRLPPDEPVEAGHLTSPAGRILAAWRHPETELGLQWRCGDHGPEHDWHARDHHHYTTPHLLVRRAARTGQPLADFLLNRFETPISSDAEVRHLDWWPAMLPFHRETAAAHLGPYVVHSYGRPHVQAEHARALARAGGPAGAAFAAVLARVLGDPQETEAVDVLLEVAARGELPAAEVGRQAGLLLASGEVKMSDMIAALDTAAQGGAHAQVWEIMAAALPVVLPEPGARPRNGSAAFVALAGTVARWCGARGEIPRVRDLAARRGSSALLSELRALHALLTTDTSADVAREGA